MSTKERHVGTVILSVLVALLLALSRPPAGLADGQGSTPDEAGGEPWSAVVASGPPAMAAGFSLWQPKGTHPSADLTVCPAGPPACMYSRIQEAVNAAGTGDVIKVAVGTYTDLHAIAGVTQVVYLSKTLTVRGGYDPSFAEPPDPAANPTVLDAQGLGRALYITGTVSPVVGGLILQHGDASGLAGDPVGFDVGGGLYANNTAALITACQVLSSSAEFGGGVALYNGTPTLQGSAVLTNTAALGGGGVFLYESPATIESTMMRSNTANGQDINFHGGGGLYMDSSAALVHNSVIEYNQAMTSSGGGLFLFNSPADVDSNTVKGNHAIQGGAVYMLQSPAEVRANVIVENTAVGWPAGLFVLNTTSFTLTNNTVAFNLCQANGPGAMLVVLSQGTLLHNTFVDNHPFPWMIGLEANSSLALTNTLFGPPGGIWVSGDCSVLLDTTLWLPGIPTVGGTGTIISSTNYYGDPQFVVPLFHIGPSSAARDRGADAGVVVDIDGEARPYGPAPDIGSDEFHPAAGLVVTKAAHPDPVQAGAPLTYTLRVTNTGNVTLTATISDVLPLQVTPTGVLTWTAQLPHPAGVWTATVVVTIDLDYTGPLSNVVVVTTVEGAIGQYTETTTVTDAPIAGLQAFNDSPTPLGSATTLTATITAGSNVSFTWAFGEGTSGAGAVLTHTYPTVGTFTAVVTASNSVSVLSTTTTVLITSAAFRVYLPLAVKGG